MPSGISYEHVGHLVDLQNVETFAVLGPTIQFLTPREDESGPCVMRGTIPPGGFVSVHTHADPETFLTISGAVESLVYAGNSFKWVRINSGDVFHVPGNAKHAWRNQGPVPAVMIVISTSRIGRFFREVGTPVAPGKPPASPSPQDVQRFLKISERYGYWNATPEENARVGLV